MAVRVETALVSLWRHGESTAESDFVCSGVWVDEAWVLTVRHAVESHPDALWIRAAAAGQQSYPVKQRLLMPHDAGPDVALLRVDVMPPGSTALPLEDSQALRGKSFDLYGSFEGRLLEPLKVTAKDFDSGAKPFPRHLFEPKQPRGFSGAPLVLNGRIWGLATEHYTDSNVLMGCALGIHQVAPWLKQSLPRYAKPNGQDGLGPVANAHAYGDHLAALLQSMRDVAAIRPIADGQLFQLSIDVPVPVAKAVAVEDPAYRGRAAIEAVVEVASVLTEAVAEGRISLSQAQRRRSRSTLLAAMGSAARLCLDLDGVPAVSGLAVTVEIEAALVFGAMLVLRAAPHKAWKREWAEGQERVSDRYTASVSTELGDGQPATNLLERIAFAQLSPDGHVPPELSVAQKAVLQGDLMNLAAEGKRLCIQLAGADPGPSASEVKDWADRHEVTLLQLRRPDSARVFLVPEAFLHGRVKKFMALFPDDEWPAA